MQVLEPSLVVSEQQIKMIVLEKVLYNKVWQSLFGLPGKTCLFKHNALRRNSQIPASLGQFLSNLVSSGVRESGLKWSSLLCTIFFLQCVALNSLLFPFLIGKSLAASVSLCSFFLGFSESPSTMLFETEFKELKTVFQAWEHYQSWYKNSYCFLVVPCKS